MYVCTNAYVISAAGVVYVVAPFNFLFVPLLDVTCLCAGVCAGAGVYLCVCVCMCVTS